MGRRLTGTFMNKKEAAEYLGVSPRVLARYAEQGKISVKYVQGKNGKEARYEKDDLDRMKEDKGTAVHRPALVPKDEHPKEGDGSLVPAAVTLDKERLLLLLEALSPGKRPLLLTEIAVKPLLKLDEASSYTGLSRQILKEAIRSGRLTAQKIGRTWRVKRQDIDAFIDSL